ncbi:carboxylesterase/lipase family protein [Actinoalloteichus caeruleus]|uniref:Para-nitrobenzyl esterase n=1 Tax=Actinoalloteichus caeruleus DSM 43889 TaxID=1120930 RepID=A0ABT1JGA0_ACTCY|nr:carboxylesterase family protein [Actinoalloteichus caeruleus]MCP2331524.1 para-nitrobenzyl esterase [Actinoalloteichus caeruleus DSM 43889]
MRREITTTSGRVRGRQAAPGVRAHLGIPYADPPFGPLRFRPPRPRRPWAGVRDCVTFGPVAPQSARLTGLPVWAADEEDILTLNVWAPAGSGGPWPVLTWFHGGAYTFGSSAQPDFDGARLAATGMVVVTVNYRLGFEGFGHLPGTPDNRGLLDQLAALDWVAANIAEFGGDPDRVTAAGQSAGAGSVLALAASDRATPFHRAILHSPPQGFRSPAEAATVADRIATAAGVRPADLGSAPPEALVRAADLVAGDHSAGRWPGRWRHDPVLYGPVVDGELLRADPAPSLAQGAAAGTPLLVTHTTEEYWLFHAVGGLNPVRTEGELARFADDLGLPAALPAGYRRLLPNATVEELWLTIFGDLRYGEYATRLVESQVAAGGAAWLALFDRRRDASGQRVRAWHHADVPFVFGTLDAPGADFLIGAVGTDEHRLARHVGAAVLRFAAHGDPGWTPFHGGTGPVEVWGGEPRSVPATDPARRALWEDVPLGPAPA